jgi:hypothetical protein
MIGKFDGAVGSSSSSYPLASGRRFESCSRYLLKSLKSKDLRLFSFKGVFRPLAWSSKLKYLPFQSITACVLRTQLTTIKNCIIEFVFLS